MLAGDLIETTVKQCKHVYTLMSLPSSTRKTHGDEGYMHRLATLAGVRKTNAFSTARWQWPSHWDGVETESEFIHIRPKMIENGKEVRVPKEEAYRSLVEKGII